jgi:hypothetical protein
VGNREVRETGEWKWDGKEVVWTVGNRDGDMAKTKKAGATRKSKKTDKQISPMDNDCKPRPCQPAKKKTAAPLDLASSESKRSAASSQAKPPMKAAIANQAKRLQSASALRPAATTSGRKAIQSRKTKGKEVKSRVIQLQLPKSSISKTKATSAADARGKSRTHWSLCPSLRGEHCTCLAE